MSLWCSDPTWEEVQLGSVGLSWVQLVGCSSRRCVSYGNGVIAAVCATPGLIEC